MTRTGSLVKIMTFAALLCTPLPALAQTAGAAQSFAILGGAAVNANGVGSVVAGDVGINPAAASNITGFPASAIIVPPFANHGNDGTAINASTATVTLFNSAELAPAGGTPTGANLSISGPTANGIYPPGKYFVNVGTALLPVGSTMTLNGPGTYIFTVNSDLTANVGSSIVLIGVDPCNVWWRVPTQATLNGTSFVGTVVSNALIALGANATLAGRALTTAPGSVTLAGTNSIGGCSATAAAPPPPPSGTPDLGITKRGPSSFTVGANGTYTITVGNTGTAASSGTITVTDTLPASLTFVPGTAGEGWSCSAVGQLVTCSTSASVGVGRSSEDLRLTVRPGPGAVPSVTNNATVAGGGETNTSNNSSTLVTPVNNAVPTLSEWAMLALVALLGLAGFAAIRRRRAL